MGHDLFKLGFDAFRDQAGMSTDSEERFVQNIESSDDYRQYLDSFLKYEALFGSGQKHKILAYVETINARSKKFPLSYDTLDKTFLRFFLFPKPAKEPLKTSLEYRELEKKNIGTLMDIFVEEILDKKFNFDTGIFKIEERLSNDPHSIDVRHLSAYRICRRPAMIVWMEELKEAIVRMLATKNLFEKSSCPVSYPRTCKMQHRDIILLFLLPPYQ